MICSASRQRSVLTLLIASLVPCALVCHIGLGLGGMVHRCLGKTEPCRLVATSCFPYPNFAGSTYIEASYGCISSLRLSFSEGIFTSRASQVVKYLPASAGDVDSIPGSGRCGGGGNGNPLQYSCLENPVDGGARWAVGHGVPKSWTQLSH